MEKSPSPYCGIRNLLLSGHNLNSQSYFLSLPLIYVPGKLRCLPFLGNSSFFYAHFAHSVPFFLENYVTISLVSQSYLFSNTQLKCPSPLSFSSSKLTETFGDISTCVLWKELLNHKEDFWFCFWTLAFCFELNLKLVLNFCFNH